MKVYSLSLSSASKPHALPPTSNASSDFPLPLPLPKTIQDQDEMKATKTSSSTSSSTRPSPIYPFCFCFLFLYHPNHKTAHARLLSFQKLVFLRQFMLLVKLQPYLPTVPNPLSTERERKGKGKEKAYLKHFLYMIFLLVCMYYVCINKWRRV